MQESAKFEIISDEYPLVYVRYNDNGKLLVAINPMKESKSIKIDSIVCEECIYSFNGESKIIDGKLISPPMSASYIKIK